MCMNSIIYVIRSYVSQTAWDNNMHDHLCTNKTKSWGKLQKCYPNMANVIYKQLLKHLGCQHVRDCQTNEFCDGHGICKKGISIISL